MNTIKVKIENIKNIEIGEFEFPMEKGVFSLVGVNGSGKSTILLVLAQLISRHNLGSLKSEDFEENSKITFEMDNIIDVWSYDTQQNWWVSNIFPRTIKMNGLYEGSLFYGTRFNDSRRIDQLLEDGELKPEEIVDADDYVIDKLSFILHGDLIHYRSLKRVKNKFITERMGVSNTPYFNEIKAKVISQYRMSSGECLLITLLHFLYNSIVRKSLPTSKRILVLIDEIELALHPIAVSRLIDLLNELLVNHDNLTVILSSHSPEVIRKIKPANLYKVSNNNGNLSLESNCYPSYLIRDVYSHDGFDFLFLVEDNLIKGVLEKILFKEGLKNSKLIHIVPVGGWKNVLDLHKDLLRWNVLGVGTQIISVLDGDIKDEVPAEFNDVRKLFLPIKSVEKYLYKILVAEPDLQITKVLNDKYFTLKSIDTLVREFKLRYSEDVAQPDKKFYFSLKKDLETRRISEEYFINNLSDDLIQNINFATFVNSVKRILT